MPVQYNTQFFRAKEPDEINPSRIPPSLSCLSSTQACILRDPGLLLKRLIFAKIITTMEDENNLFHKISPGPTPPQEIYCLVEIPKGGSNKYEYDKDLGVFKLDRALYGSVFYPTEYGFIPQTWAEDNDPLDVMVLSTFTTFPGCLLKARPIGLLDIIDSGERDSKIISVASSDPRFEDTESLEDLNTHFKKEITNFWETYAELQPKKKIEIDAWKEIKEAQEVIKKAINTYKSTFITT